MVKTINKKEILVVDDEKEICRMLEKALKNNYAVSSVGNGEDAIEFVSKRKPRLVILDLKLPGKNGAETLSELKKKSDSLPVILISGINGASADGSREAGADGFMAKPLDMNKLSKLVSRLVGGDVDSVSGLPLAMEPFLKSALNDIEDKKVDLNGAVNRVMNKYINYLIRKYNKNIH